MASVRAPSAQTQREIREIGRPLEVVNHQQTALLATKLRLRGDLVTMADSRMAGRYRGEMKRRLVASGGDVVIPTETEWLGDECEDLIKSFDYSYPVGQERARHMVDFASQDGFMLFDGVKGPEWLPVYWELRYNQRNRYSEQRLIMAIGTSEESTREHGYTPTVKFQKVTVQEWQQWFEYQRSLYPFYG